MFDPEKVERRLISGDYDESWRPDLTEAEGWGTAEEAYRHSVVSTEDYDQLLALYRELEPLPPDPKTLPTIEEMRGLVPDFTGGLTVSEFVDS